MLKYLLSVCMMMLSLVLHAEDITVKSHIVDAETGEALPYVGVYAGEDNGTLTNYEGDFTIIVDSAAVLRLTCIGYQEVTLPALDFPQKVKMKPLTHSMREVQVRAWPNILKKVAEKSNKEYNSKKNKKSQYFMRMTTTLRNRDLAEAFVEAKSAFNLRDITMLRGINGRITQQGLTTPIISRMNFHHTLETGPLTRDSKFWSGLVTPLPHGGSFKGMLPFFMFNPNMSESSIIETVKNVTHTDPWLRYLTDNYDITGEELIDEQQNLIYRIHMDKKPGNTSTKIIMTGTLYIDAKSMRPLRFDGQVENLKLQAQKDMHIVSTPIEMSLHINYHHDKKYTQVSDIAIKMKKDDFSSQILLYNVDDLKLDIKVDKKNRTKENMLESIADAGFDMELWKRANIIQRTKEEERLAGLENQSELVADTIPQPTTKMGKLLDRLSRFSQSIPQEKVYLHMDNTSYFLGDTIWFAAYTRQTNNDQPSKISRVLYVELYNQDGYMMERKLVPMVNGHGHGSFALSKEYYGGFYELRAYTRWQLNWGVTEHPHSRISREWYLNEEQEKLHYRDYEKLYSRVFPVYDAPKKEGEYIENMTARPMRRYFKKDPDKPSLDMTLYPEGGNLVEGLPCRVAYEVLWEDGEEPGDGILNLGDEDGKEASKNAKQQAKDRKKQSKQALKNVTKKSKTGTQNNKTIASNATSAEVADTLNWKKHRGTFLVTPTKDMERTIRFVDRNGHEAKAKLPKPEPEGVALRVEQTDTTWTFDMAFTQGIDCDSLGLSIMNEGNVLKVLTLDSLGVDTLTRRATLSLPKTALKEGVNQVTVFDVDSRIWADRLFYNTLPDSILSHTAQAKGKVAIQFLGTQEEGETASLMQPASQLPVNELNFAPYQHIRLGVQSSPNSIISMSVRDAAYHDHLYDNADMRTEMLLSSEVRGFIPNPKWYFEKDDSIHRAALDLLLMIQGWRRFNWREMAIPNEWELTQNAESTPTITGHVYKSSNWEYHDFTEWDYDAQARLSGAYNPNNPSGLIYGRPTAKDDDDEMPDETKDPYKNLYEFYDMRQTRIDLAEDNAKKKKKNDMVVHAELVSADGTETRVAEQTTQNGRFRMLLPGFYGEAVLFLSAADTTKWWSKDMTKKKIKNRYTWVQSREKETADYKVIVDFPYPRFVKPYNYYQQRLLQTSDPLMGASLLADGTHQMHELFVGAKRNGLKSFSDSIPAFMVDAYQAWNDAIDGGIYYPSPEMIVRNYLGDYGSSHPYYIKTNPETGQTYQMSGIITRFGYDITRRATHNLTTAEDSVYMRGNLASFQPFDEFGQPLVFLTPTEIAKYYDRSRIEKYVIYTDYQPRLEGSNRYKGSDLPKTVIAIYPYADDGIRPIYRDRRFRYKGFAYHDDFYHPNYKNRKLDEQPKDYRRTLYWNPALVLDKEGHAEVKLYNNGKHGQISVSAEGMTKDGTILGN